MAKKNVFDFAAMKRKGEQITWITAYDFPTASLGVCLSNTLGPATEV